MMPSKKNVYWITFITINGGFLFGLNIAGIAGANAMIKNEFGLTDAALGTVAALLTIGALFGALFTGKFADQYGRKKVMIATAVLYTLAALGCALATSALVLNIGRIISGIAVGATSVVAPLYIAEIAPAKNRGTLVSLNQFAITIGILCAYIFDFFLIELGSNSWRYMLGVPAVFGLLFLVLLVISLPESPRWLSTKDKSGNPSVKEEISIRELFKGKVGKVVLIGTILAAFQQITGVNAVLIYAPDIFEAAGSMKEGALFLSMILGLINFLMTIIALWLVDSKGRKTLLLWGAAGMSLSLIYLTYVFGNQLSHPTGVLLALLLYVSFFAASFAPVMWVIISEIYPAHIKGKAMSFSTAVCWLGTFLTIQFAPIIRGGLGIEWLFAIFAGFSALAFLFVKIAIPETKGKSLEQIEKELGLSE